jgi:hypothetical protein
MGERTFWQKLTEQLYLRLWVARKSSWAALGLVAADVVVAQLEVAPLPSWAHALVGLVATGLALYKGKAVLPQNVATKTNVLKTLALLIGVSVAGAAFAQEEATTPAVEPAAPDIAFGGCFGTKKLGQVCAGPAASVSVLKLEGGKFLTGFTVGGGYGASIFSDRWYSLGVSVQALHSVSSEDEPLTAAVMGCFARYLRVGVGRGGTVLLALGVGG